MKAVEADAAVFFLFMGHFIIHPNGVPIEPNAKSVYEGYEDDAWWEEACLALQDGAQK